MFDDMNRKDRLRLLKFVCSFAWADFRIRDQEREFVRGLVERFELEEEDREKVAGWLEDPPEPDSIDPGLVPAAHREIFLDAIRGLISADNEIAPEERESFEILEDLFGTIDT